MSQDETLHLRHTSEGADKTRKEVEALAGAQGKVTKESGKLSDATDDLNIKKENLTNILNKVNPALGGLADGLFNAAELAGELGSKSLNLNGIMSAGRKGVVKYKDALLLLGAGGAAFLAITALVNAWKELVAAEKEAVKIFDDFQKRQLKIKETSQQLREKVATTLNEQTGGNSTEDDVQRVLRIRRRNINAGVDPATAFDIAMGKRQPLTGKQLQKQRDNVRTPVDKLKAAQREALQATPTGALLFGQKAVFTGDTTELREFVSKHTNGNVDEILAQLAALSLLLQDPDPGFKILRKPGRPIEESFSTDVQSIASQLNIRGQLDRQRRKEAGHDVDRASRRRQGTPERSEKTLPDETTAVPHVNRASRRFPGRASPDQPAEKMAAGVNPAM